MKLKWGQTPWDKMGRDELLREVQRMYAALVAARSCLAIARNADPLSGYWGGEGSGGKALAMAHEALAVPDRIGEDVYRSYFRYAVDLLFKSPVGYGWMVCDTCDEMLAGGSSGATPTKCTSGHAMRRIEWRDMDPRK